MTVYHDLGDIVNASENAPTVGNLASAFWGALVLWAAQFVSLPGEEGLAVAVVAAGVALAIALPPYLVGRFTQSRFTDPKR